jgi:hypothetical protein
MKMPSRYLTQPTIRFLDSTINLNEKAQAKTKAGKQIAYWDISGQKFGHVPDKYPKLKVLRLYNDQKGGLDKASVERFVKTLVPALKTYGFETETAAFHSLDISRNIWDDDSQKRRQNWSRELEKAYVQLDSPTLIVILLPNDIPMIYADIKRWADCEKGIPTVCVTPKAVRKNYNTKDFNHKPTNTGDPRLLGNIW